MPDMNRYAVHKHQEWRNTMSTSNTNPQNNAQKGTPSKNNAPYDHSLALINIFAPEQPFQKNRSGVEYLSHLVLEIASLKERLDRPEQQDFYFRKGIKANKQKLSSLIQHFFAFRDEVNTCHIEDLLEQVSGIEAFLQRYEKTAQAGFIKEIVKHSKISQVKHLEILLGLKTVVGRIRNLNYYL